MRTVAFLDLRIAALAELQVDSGVPCAANIAGFAGGELFLARPPAKHRHSGRNLVEVSLNHLLQTTNPPFPPGIEVARRQQSHTAEHVDAGDIGVIRESGFGGLSDSL